VRRASHRWDQNLDPLLDTMANVVGILVMLVAVTQLSVVDAVDRIRDEGARREVSQQSVTLAEQKREHLEQALAEAGERLIELEPGGRAGLLLLDAAPLLDELAGLPGRAELRGLGSQELRARVEVARAELEHREQQIERGRRRATELDELLRGLPTEPRSKIARLPDPRPPPAGSRELLFLCRHGRIAAVDPEGMNQALWDGITRALGETRLPKREERIWVQNLFAKGIFGHGGLHWQLREEQGDTLFADVRLHDLEQAESLVDLRLGDSEYAESLGRQSPREYYARYFVWPDSFDVYLEARYLAESRGYPVSWTEVGPEENVGVTLAGPRRQLRPVLID
jgi:hypothetical protein